MSKLHIVFNLYLDTFGANGTKDRTIVNSQTHKYILFELKEYKLDWMDNMINDDNVFIVGSDYNSKTYQYHMWIKNKDGSNFRSAQLSRLIHYTKPENGSWYKNASMLDYKDLNELDVKMIKLVPVIGRILVVTEQEVKINKLPEFQNP